LFNSGLIHGLINSNINVVNLVVIARMFTVVQMR
jgi:hypothetical protein